VPTKIPRPLSGKPAHRIGEIAADLSCQEKDVEELVRGGELRCCVHLPRQVSEDAQGRRRGEIPTGYYRVVPDDVAVVLTGRHRPSEEVWERGFQVSRPRWLAVIAEEPSTIARVNYWPNRYALLITAEERARFLAKHSTRATDEAEATPRLRPNQRDRERARGMAQVLLEQNPDATKRKIAEEVKARFVQDREPSGNLETYKIETFEDWIQDVPGAAWKPGPRRRKGKLPGSKLRRA
jgi:hypothetical protein